MNNNCGKIEISPRPCSADQFSGRFDEREKLIEVLRAAKDQAQVVMISGRRGSGKSSFLNWAENAIQSETDGEGCPAIKKGFNETPGMVIATYRELLIGLKEYNKFGWFEKTLEESKIKKYLDLSLSLLEKMSSLAGPYSIGINAGVTAARGLMPEAIVDYAQLRSSFDSILRGVSEELIKNNKILGILLDDIQWSSEPDFQLLKDLMRELPTGIVLIIAFRVEVKSEKRYAELKEELDRFNYLEIPLSGMDGEEIEELAKLRYDLSLDDESTRYLSEAIGDPFCLVGCLNLLQRQRLEPILSNFQKLVPQAADSARCIYTGLDDIWQKRINSLCILLPPMPLKVIFCMLKEDDLAKLKDELDHSLVFRNNERDSERYDFAHPSLREYRKKELPKSMVTELNSQAAKCISNLIGGS
jgi:energy-coupling factor transporter ATP-binding protein EcfA2